ncbi:hypothetical protein BX265_6889 [Streptomyces sp. TLI_235]|nr:hypothetical protein [Streptomyces sp. TLI_235]PBC69560.1 hypothetical protein BX265_6889 [Streptomyces sp. TLI_235]
MQLSLPATRSVLGAGVFAAAALSLLPATPAQAAAAAQTCGPAGVEHSFDGGKTWTTAFTMTGPAPTVIAVRLTTPPGAGCHYALSLASYSAQGPTWESSGTQKFLGWATGLIDQQHPTLTLDISAHKPACYGQIDLYGGNLKFDGIQAPLPKYPDSATPTNMVAAWNGGAACAKPTPTPSGSPTPSNSPTPKPSPSTAAPTPQPSHSSPAPVPQPSRSAAAVPPVPSTPPTGSTVSPPSLAQTGSSGTGVIAALSAAALALGCGVLYLARGTRRRRH